MTFASWKKCDFQIHTCRDPNWGGARPVGLGDVNTSNGPASMNDVEDARNMWAKEFVATCLKRGLQAIAVTDHHETVMVPYVRAAVAEHNAQHPESPLWLFPGMELTAKGGKQCLVLFDHDISDDWLQQARGKLGIIFAGAEDKKAQAPKVTQLTVDYPNIVDALNELPPLRSRFILLPNVSQSGVHTVLADGAHADFLRMACVGGYLDRGQTHATLSDKNRTRLSGADPTWSKREVYALQTSDCRSADRLHLGKNDAWIKLEEPTAEAIRQAFLAHRSRIRITPPEIPSVYVKNVTVEGSSILEDATLDLSPEQNSIIGGRGSGKSSLLEYVAFGLGRSCSDLTERHQYSGNSRLVELVTDTLKSQSGTVRLTISQDGATFSIVCGPDTAYQPQITYPDGSYQSVSTKDLRSLFPAVIYSQGELAELGKLTASKTDLTDLLQFVNPAYKQEDDAVSASIESAKRAVRLALERQIESWTLHANVRKQKATASALKERIVSLERTLPALSEDDQKVVDDFEAASQFEIGRQQYSKHADAMVLGIEQLLTEHSDAREAVMLETDEAEAIRKSYAGMQATVATTISTLKADLNVRRAQLQRAEGAWNSKLAETRKARDAVLEKLSTHKAATAQIIKLKEELASIINLVGDLEARLKAFGDSAKSLSSQILQLKMCVDERSQKTKTWASDIQSLSSEKIVAKVSVDGNLDELREALDIVAAKTGSQEATRIKEVDASVLSLGAWTFIDRLRTDALSLVHWAYLGSTDGEEKPQASDLFRVSGTSEKTKSALTELMDATRLAALATAVPKPQIELSYSDGGREIAFEKASEGQRAAALLFMLLQQPGGPLIIDQPEGDLDNSIITDLTDKLPQAKQKRQLLFASHNANIVVNGSSELVAHLGVNEQGTRVFESVGAIDSPLVRNAITRTMEGGEKAFRDRKEKYGF